MQSEQYLPQVSGDSVVTETNSSTTQRMMVIGGLYLAQSIPIYFFSVGLPTILREQKVPNSLIGLFSILMIPWAFKFLWAPWVDRYHMPLARFMPRGRWLGHRQSWMSLFQILCALLIATMAGVDAVTQTLLLLGIGLLISLVSATQDIAIDAFVIENLPEKSRAGGNVLQASGAALGNVIGGAFILFIYSHLGWQKALFLLMLLTLVAGIPVFFVREQTRESRPSSQNFKARGAEISLRRSFANPALKQLIILAFAYRSCEGLVMGMQQSFLVDSGLSLEKIGALIGIGGSLVGVAFSILSGFLQQKAGAKNSLLLSGSLRTIIFATYAGTAALIASGGGSASFLTVLVLCNMAVRYLTFVPLYTAYMNATDKRQAGTDFAVLIGADYLFYFVGAALSGVVAQHFGYARLFSIATMCSAFSVLWLHKTSLFPATQNTQ